MLLGFVIGLVCGAVFGMLVACIIVSKGGGNDE